MLGPIRPPGLKYCDRGAAAAGTRQLPLTRGPKSPKSPAWHRYHHWPRTGFWLWQYPAIVRCATIRHHGRRTSKRTENIDDSASSWSDTTCRPAISASQLSDSTHLASDATHCIRNRPYRTTLHRGRRCRNRQALPTCCGQASAGSGQKATPLDSRCCPDLRR